MEAFFLSDDISHVIQLAVAPVFLLASISGALNVLSLRMGRIIDRGRKLNEMSVLPNSPQAQAIDKEQQLLSERSRLIHRAIAMCTLSALFVCLVIVCLFIDVLFKLGMTFFIAFLFIVALLALIMALLNFLREIDKSTSAFSFGRYHMNNENNEKK